jgi:hypothetical protein
MSHFENVQLRGRSRDDSDEIGTDDVVCSSLSSAKLDNIILENICRNMFRLLILRTFLEIFSHSHLTF